MTQTPPQEQAPVAGLSYEQARDELVALVARIESGQVPLEDAMLLWERGEALATHCQAKLDAAQETLDRATGQAAAQPSAGTDHDDSSEQPGSAASAEDDRDA